MNKTDFLKTTVLAALAAAPLFALTAQSSVAQQVVAATCPSGYVLTGNRCVRTGPTPSCPSGYAFSGGKCVASSTVQSQAAKTAASGGQWAFVTREAFGVKNAVELDGANYCAVDGSPAANAAKDFFKDNDMDVTLVKVDTDRTGIEKYQKYDCDVLVVASHTARATADKLKPVGGHMVLPEKLGDPESTPEPVAAPAAPAVAPATPVVAPATPAPLPPKPPAAVKAQPKPQQVVRKPRCSAIRYAYTSGNTCSCAGGRVFTGRSCARPKRW